MTDKDSGLYTVRDICERFNLTRKTLFYYDRIGLLKPTKRIGVQLHKVYDDSAVSLLERIIVYREAGLTIEEVRKMISAVDNAECLVTLNKVRSRLISEVEHKHQEIRNIDRLIMDYQSVNRR